MARGVRHTKYQHTSVCRYCNKEFLSKKPNKQVCYEPPCQRAQEAEHNRDRYERQMAQRRAADAVTAALKGAGRFNDRQLHNLLLRHPPEVSIPLALHELAQRIMRVVEPFPPPESEDGER